MNKKTLKSIGAVLAGFLVVVVLSVGTDMVMHAAGVFSAMGQTMAESLFVLATAYRTLYSIAGAYIAAQLAPDRPMAHALALGVLGLAVSILGAAVTWNKIPAFGPHWYPLALIVLAMPQCSTRCSCAHALRSEARPRSWAPTASTFFGHWRSCMK
jgi:hypothetical protein